MMVSFQDRHTSLMDIVDEVYDLVDNEIDAIRGDPLYRANDKTVCLQMEFLKNIRSILKLSENFRDE